MGAAGLQPQSPVRKRTGERREQDAFPEKQRAGLNIMSEYQKEIPVLSEGFLLAERRRSDLRITQVQSDEHRVRRAVFLMTLLTGLGAGGLCYSALFLPDFPHNTSHVALKLFGALGLASLISLLAFVGFQVVHRKQLEQCGEESRQLTRELVKSRLAKIWTISAAAPASARTEVVNGGGEGVSPASYGTPAKGLVEPSIFRIADEPAKRLGTGVSSY